MEVDMIYKREDASREAALAVGKKMVAAAITAPKGCGHDNVEAVLLDGEEMMTLAKYCREIGEESGVDFFIRDAHTIELSHCIVLIGANNNPILLDGCGLCGLENCANTKAAGANCAFNIVDLGIAIGSAVGVAADNRIDNRVLFSGGVAALKMGGLFSDNVNVCFAIPLSTYSKNIFYDREADDSLLNKGL